MNRLLVLTALIVSLSSCGEENESEILEGNGVMNLNGQKIMIYDATVGHYSSGYTDWTSLVAFTSEGVLQARIQTHDESLEVSLAPPSNNYNEVYYKVYDDDEVVLTSYFSNFGILTVRPGQNGLMISFESNVYECIGDGKGNCNEETTASMNGKIHALWRGES